jgi:hypothetical protein
MNFLKLPLAYLLIIAVVAVPVAGQQKRRSQEKTPAKAPAAPAPAPTPTATPEPATPVTFDTLLAADIFKIYGEVRGAGQLVRSNAANDVLEPFLRLSNPPAEFTDIVDWLRAHSDQLMTSRLMVAAWPNVPEVPDVMVAIEFSSVEDATKFEAQLNKVLAKILPPETPPSEPENEKKPKPDQTSSEKPKAPAAPVPSYYLQRADSLVLVSPKPLQLKKLRPKDSKLLSEDPNFRVAYNRFSSEPIFVFVDIGAMQKENTERQKKAEEEWKKQREAQEAAAAKEKAEAEAKGEEYDPQGLTEEEKAAASVEITPEPSPEVPPETPKEPTDAEKLSNAFGGLRNLLFGVQPHLPVAVGFGFTPDNESFDLRALMIDAAGETSDPIPLFSGLKVGDPVTPESPGVLPADTELVIMLSLDFAQIHEMASAFETQDTKVVTEARFTTTPGRLVMQQPPELAEPLKTIERILKINVKDEVLPLLGSEVAVSMPVSEFGLFGPPVSGPRQIEKDDATPPRTPFVVISLRDREGMKKMMPRILEGFAGKAASSLAQSEKREDTELVSIANMFAYAFVGNFLVIGVDAATTRSVVDSYLKGETLASTAHFRNYTRWEPRQLQAQLYLSPAFADGFRTWASSPSAHISDEARAYMTRVTTNPQPITYALSNDGLGWLHEAHFPKSLVVTAIASAASTANPPQTVKNERSAMSVLWSIYSAQYRYKEEKKGGYASLEDLISADMVSKETMDSSGYKFELRLVPEGFEVSATPVEYGKTGKLSFFMDHTAATIKGGDHGGGPASASDLPIGY